ncbi:hypothetical protein M378DRAFT_180899 [Amanita muscaria Koide BX008]|uniref:Uncharacterized protein n=1 Tax=Amanita muscaria (strain Koide BX008) TaxID=946122 RepID=A0A0C2SYK8_AMAMK|nr:hypothetical protein M378DRAFT_180899 [Amanita muscaria Koide BX008]
MYQDLLEMERKLDWNMRRPSRARIVTGHAFCMLDYLAHRCVGRCNNIHNFTGIQLVKLRWDSISKVLNYDVINTSKTVASPWDQSVQLIEEYDTGRGCSKSLSHCPLALGDNITLEICNSGGRNANLQWQESLDSR